MPVSTSFADFANYVVAILEEENSGDTITISELIDKLPGLEADAEKIAGLRLAVAVANEYGTEDDIERLFDFDQQFFEKGRF